MPTTVTAHHIFHKMQKYLKVIIKEMCNRVGVNFDKVNFKNKEWFMKHEWTEKEQDNFREWLISYLSKEKEARQEIMRIPSNNKRFVEDAANQFILMWGWKQNV